MNFDRMAVFKPVLKAALSIALVAIPALWAADPDAQPVKPTTPDTPPPTITPDKPATVKIPAGQSLLKPDVPPGTPDWSPFKLPAQSVPPEGQDAYDPKPLMDKVRERITTPKFTFAVLGDSKHASTFPKLVQYLDKTMKPDFVLTTGDMVERGGGKPGPGFWEKLGRDAGEAMRNRPWWPAIGNHEISGELLIGKDALDPNSDKLKSNKITGSLNFCKFYNLPKEYYTFDFQGFRFIALPFKYPELESEKWLEQQLKDAKKKKLKVIAYNHCPFFTIGGKSKKEITNLETNITKMFTKYEVLAVFSGHDHSYYRTVRGGIPYIVTAGGGATISPGLRKSEALLEDVYYFMDPDSVKPGKTKEFLLHRPGSEDRRMPKPEQFASLVEVDGDKITCKCVSSDGLIWDNFELPVKDK